MPNTTDINKLKALRQASGLTQQQLADKAGIHIRMVQKFENGEREIKNMTLETAKKLASALGVDIGELLK